MKYKLINSQTKEEHLCEKVTTDGFDYYVNDYISDEVNGDLTKIKINVLHQISVATTNPNIDIPQVVDAAERLAWEDNPLKKLDGEFLRGSFKRGYNKAKEIYAFSEEDVCEFVEWINLHYRALEHTISFKGVKGTKELLQLWKEQQTKIIYMAQTKKQEEEVKQAMKQSPPKDESSYLFSIQGCPGYKGYVSKKLGHEVCKYCGNIEYYH